MIEQLRAAVFATIAEAVEQQKANSWAALGANDTVTAQHASLRAEGMEMVRVKIAANLKKWVDADE